MRAPLRAMHGFAEKLREDYAGKPMDAEAGDYLSRISRAAVRLDLLIQDVLTYTRVMRAEVPMQEVDLERLIADLVEAYPQWQAPNAEVRITGGLPIIRGNEALLTQCFSNLIGNAVKFVEPGVKPCVTIRAEPVGMQTRIWFEDNGVGIASENHRRIFRLFERIYPTSQFEGTGVGLTIVRKAVERMNGEVGFESELGKGSKFWIQL
jgi:signal transduction histidine kinase